MDPLIFKDTWIYDDLRLDVPKVAKELIERVDRLTEQDYTFLKETKFSENSVLYSLQTKKHHYGIHIANTTEEGRSRVRIQPIKEESLGRPLEEVLKIANIIIGLQK